MRDERINERLNIIKRNNTIIVAIVSTVFLFFKIIIIINPTLANIIPEIYLILSSGIVILIATIIKTSDGVSDERTIQKSLNVYNKGFWFVVLSGILIYFISLLFIDFNLNTVNLAPNSGINSIMFWCMLLSIINVRKNNMTFNPLIIEYDKKKYYNIIAKRILFMFLYYLGVLVVVYFISLFVNSYITDLSLIIAIIISFVTIAIQYFMFSVYEKYHYDEMIKKEDEGKIPYVSKKVWLLVLIIGIQSIIALVSNGMQLYLVHIDQTETNLYMISYLVTLITKLQYIDLFVLKIIMYVIIFKTIRQLDVWFKKYIPVGIIIVVIIFVGGLLSEIYSNIFPYIDYEIIPSVMNIYGIFRSGLFMLELVFNITICILLLKDRFITEGILYFISIVFIPFITFQILAKLDAIEKILKYGYIISATFAIICLIIKLIFVRILSNKHKLIEPHNDIFETLNEEYI